MWLIICHVSQFESFVNIAGSWPHLLTKCTRVSSQWTALRDYTTNEHIHIDNCYNARDIKNQLVLLTFHNNITCNYKQIKCALCCSLINLKNDIIGKLLWYKRNKTLIWPYHVTLLLIIILEQHSQLWCIPHTYNMDYRFFRTSQTQLRYITSS